MKILFLGCGYLGYNLSEILKKKRNVEVWGIESPYTPLSTCLKNRNVFDLNAFNDADIEGSIVIDTVSLVSNSARSENETMFLDELKNKYNDLFKNLKEKNIGTYYFLSSGGTVYGESSSPIDEEHPLMPKTLYAKSKVVLEECLVNSGLNYLIIRLSNPYGGYQVTDKMQGVIPILIERVIKKETFQLWGDNSTVRDYIYIDDLANAFDLLIEKKVHNGIINIGSGRGHSLKEVFELVEEKTGEQVKIEQVPSSVAIVHSIILDISKLKTSTGFEISISLADGIEKEVVRIQEELK